MTEEQTREEARAESGGGSVLDASSGELAPADAEAEELIKGLVGEHGEKPADDGAEVDPALAKILRAEIERHRDALARELGRVEPAGPPTPAPKPTDAELRRRFGYHRPPDQRSAERCAHVRGVLLECASMLRNLCEPGRELSLALTKLEEAEFWATGSIAREWPLAE